MVASVGSLVPLSMQVSRISCSTCLVGASLLRALRCAVKGALASLTVCADMMPLLHVSSIRWWGIASVPGLT